MNVFILDTDPTQCVKFYVNAHCVKIILESAQILCNAHEKAPYKKTHFNHPWSRFVRASLSNYRYVCSLALELCKEYTFRYGKRHKTQDVIEWLKTNEPNLSDIGLTSFPQAMPVDCKHVDCVVAYRAYYRKYKSHLFAWKKREKPYWI